MIENLIYTEYIGSIVVKILLLIMLITSNVYIVFAIRNECEKKKVIKEFVKINNELSTLYDLPIKEAKRILNQINS